MGSEVRFVEFVHARSAALLRLAVLLTGSREDGEDLLQTALVKAYRSWWRLRSPDLAERYVRRILVTSVISWRRRGSAREWATDRLPDRQVAGPAAEVADRVVMRQVLRSLSPGQRAVLVLRFFEDLSEQQTADLLGCSVGTVKSQTSRGLAALLASDGSVYQVALHQPGASPAVPDAATMPVAAAGRLLRHA